MCWQHIFHDVLYKSMQTRWSVALKTLAHPSKNIWQRKTRKCISSCIFYWHCLSEIEYGWIITSIVYMGFNCPSVPHLQTQFSWTAFEVWIWIFNYITHWFMWILAHDVVFYKPMQTRSGDAWISCSTMWLSDKDIKKHGNVISVAFYTSTFLVILKHG